MSSRFNAISTPVEVRPLSVSQLTARLRTTLEASFRSVWVEGEISDFKSPSSGHWYFTLVEQGYRGEIRAQLHACCFSSDNCRLRFRPSNGQLVFVRGTISVYAPHGQYQLHVRHIEAAGDGKLLIAFEQLKKRLQAEGLFDSALKRALPRFPNRVGIVTSPTGAAIKDILNILSRRTRTVHVLLSPTRVQGAGAGSEIAQAIRSLNTYHERALKAGRLADTIDVIIVGRGGGSLEDLWAFNEEVVARAIRASAIPVISAVGHETDTTIADFAADLNAPTPSAAAELVAQQEHELAIQIDKHIAALARGTRYGLVIARSQLEQTGISGALQTVRSRLRESSITGDLIAQRLQQAIEKVLSNLKHETKDLRNRLAAVSPWARLSSKKNRRANLDVQLNAVLRFHVRSAHSRARELNDRLSKYRPETRIADARFTLGELKTELDTCIRRWIRTELVKIARLDRRLIEVTPARRISTLQLVLNRLSSRLSSAMRDHIRATKGQIQLASNSLEALSPLAVLERGYAIAQDSEGVILRDAQRVAVNDEVQVRLAKGRLITRVENTQAER